MVQKFCWFFYWVEVIYLSKMARCCRVCTGLILVANIGVGIHTHEMNSGSEFKPKFWCTAGVNFHYLAWEILHLVLSPWTLYSAFSSAESTIFAKYGFRRGSCTIYSLWAKWKFVMSTSFSEHKQFFQGSEMLWYHNSADFHTLANGQQENSFSLLQRCFN